MSTHRGSFKDYLRQQLDRREWTAADLARASGLSESVIGRWLKAATLPSVDNARALANALERPMLEVVVAVGILAPEEITATVEVGPRLSTLSDEELLAEVARRVKRNGREERGGRVTVLGLPGETKSLERVQDE